MSATNFILFDDSSWGQLLPLTFSRPIAEIRFGINTIKKKWENILGSKCSYLTRPYLSIKYKTLFKEENVLINSSIIPDLDILSEINNLRNNEALVKGEVIIAINTADKGLKEVHAEIDKKYRKMDPGWSLICLFLSISSSVVRMAKPISGQGVQWSSGTIKTRILN